MLADHGMHFLLVIILYSIFACLQIYLLKNLNDFKWIPGVIKIFLTWLIGKSIERILIFPVPWLHLLDVLYQSRMLVGVYEIYDGNTMHRETGCLDTIGICNDGSNVVFITYSDYTSINFNVHVDVVTRIQVSY